MAFTLSFMPKAFSPLPSLKTSQQPRRRTIACAGAPPRKKERSGKRGKIHRIELNSLNSSQTVIEDQLNEMKREARELDGSAIKPKTSK